LVYVYEPGVFDLIPTDPTIDPIHTKMKATLTNPYACTMSRNYMKNPILKQSLRIKRISNHYIFNIESIGQHKPSVLLAEALRTLQRKCNTLLDHIEEYQVMKENM
jgi:DNA-directed RNA polymerases I and III subunit RPAC1